MPAKTHALQIVQLGQESTWGTAVTPTSKLAGITSCEITPLTEVADFPSLEGYGPIYNSAVVKTGGTATLESLVLYEDLPYWLDGLLAEDATPTGAGPYTYVYEAPTTTAPTRSFYTLTYGDSSSAYALTGALVKSVTISGAASEALTMSIEFVGHHVETDSLAALSSRTVNVATSSQVVLKIAATGTAPGSGTEIPCTLYEWELAMDNMTAVAYAVGAITPCDYYQNRFDGTLSMTLDFPGDSSAIKTIFDNMVSTTPSEVNRNIQLKASNGANLDIEINMGCVLMTAPSLWGDNDGITTVETEWKLKYNANVGAAGNYLAIDVINGVSTMP